MKPAIKVPLGSKMMSRIDKPEITKNSETKPNIA